ncbi:hypothetical protein CDD83_521 [Cordyceps sp. RAO-2017]|nr:hypothetical protein CDD83_521 [Cordyceps sp. RAO-2017]
MKDGLNPKLFREHLEWLEDIIDKRSRARDNEFRVLQSYPGHSGFHSYVGVFSSRIIEDIRLRQEVASVEEDQIVRFPKFVAEEVSQSLTKRTPHLTTQQKVPWNLWAISHRHAPTSLIPGFINDKYHLDSSGGLLPSGLSYTYKYLSDAEAEPDTYAYVIDTGIRTSHEEFEGRAEHVWTCWETYEDDSGHGTHVAGIIASKSYGVVKNARLLSVKVTKDNAAWTSQVLGAIHWTVNDILEKNRTKSAVINISQGIAFSGVVNAAINNAFLTRDIITVVAAGNQGIDASERSPGSAEHAITVGSIDSSWRVAETSNFGKSVSIFAPGRNILSLSKESDSATVVSSGTSMAAPHVAGLVLNAMTVWGKRGGGLKAFLLETATKGQIKGNLRGSPNLLANNNIDSI